jgi:transcriptional regulator with GAF, ATPase, and Fis domain
LVFRGDVLGVLALFDRGQLTDEDFRWVRLFADHAAVSIVNARAFEEIEFLKARLEEENSYLRQEVTEAVGASSIVGSSPGLRKVLQQIQLARLRTNPADSNWPMAARCSWTRSVKCR